MMQGTGQSSRVSPDRRRGVALVMAIAVLGVVAASCAALVVATTNDFSREHVERARVQTEQYKLATIALAHAQLKAGLTANGVLPLPAEAGAATVEWGSEDAGTRVCTITVGDKASNYTFRREGNGWILIKAG